MDLTQQVMSPNSTVSSGSVQHFEVLQSYLVAQRPQKWRMEIEELFNKTKGLMGILDGSIDALIDEETPPVFRLNVRKQHIEAISMLRAAVPRKQRHLFDFTGETTGEVWSKILEVLKASSKLNLDELKTKLLNEKQKPKESLLEFLRQKLSIQDEIVNGRGTCTDADVVQAFTNTINLTGIEYKIVCFSIYQADSDIEKIETILGQWTKVTEAERLRQPVAESHLVYSQRKSSPKRPREVCGYCQQLGRETNATVHPQNSCFMNPSSPSYKGDAYRARILRAINNGKRRRTAAPESQKQKTGDSVPKLEESNILEQDAVVRF